jgi:CRISPR/Cas system-associated endoribonuclease Cas2
MKVLIKYPTVCLLLILFSIPCKAQDITFKTVSGRMASAVDKFARGIKAGEFQKILRPYDLKRLDYVAERSLLNQNIILSAKVNFSQPFIISLDYDVSAYEEFLKSADILKKSKDTLVPLSTYEGLLNASSNLELKGKVLKESQKDRVEVKVNTRDNNGQEISNCLVWYTPYLKDDDQHKTKFDKFSTPTTDLMPPAKYNIWTEKDGKQGPKSPFSCGDDGRDKREIDILAPK